MKRFITKNKKEILYYAIVLIIWGIIYFPIVFQGKIFMYMDIGADTYCNYFPKYIYFRDLIENYQIWDLRIGLGTTTISYFDYIFDPFNYILLLFPINKLYLGITLELFVKYLVLSIFANLYVKQLNIKGDSFISVIVAITIVFSGWFVGWGQHYSFSTLYIYFIALLFFIELYMHKGSFFGLVITVTLLCLKNAYFAYMVLLALALYYLIRYWFLFSKKGVLSFIKHGIKTMLLCILGICCAAISFFPNVVSLLSSPRVGYNSQFELSLISKDEIVTLLLRLFNNNILGINGDFVGIRNYYEAPFVFCGIGLVIFGFIFLKNFSKNKKIFTIFMLFTVAIIFLDTISFVFNAFSTVTYRWTFFFAPFEAVVVGISLEKLFDNYKEYNKYALYGSFFGIIILGLYILYLRVNESVCSNTIFYTIFYIFAILIINIVVLPKETISLTIKKGWIYSFILLDLILNAYFCVNNRSLLTVEDIQSASYFDASNDVIRTIEEQDSSFYRISKKYGYIDLLDGLAQLYPSEKLYSSEISSSYWNIQNLFGLRGKESLYFYGFDDKQALRNLSSVKYMLTKENRSYYGYKLLNENNGIWLYENENSIPFGVLYSQYISEADFVNLPNFIQQECLYSSCVVDTETEQRIIDVPKNNDFSKEYLLPVEYTIELQDGNVLVNLQDKNTMPLVIEICLADNFEGIISGRILSKEEDTYSELDYIPIEVSANNFCYYMENTLGLSGLKLELSPDYVKEVHLYAINTEIEKEEITKLKMNSLNIEKYDEDGIVGYITSETSSIMFLPLLYDNNWEVLVNGKQQEIFCINGGYIGLSLPKGYSEIEIYYNDNSLLIGCTISVLSIIVFIIMCGLNCINLRRNICAETISQ